MESFLCGLLSAVQSINMEGLIAYLADINAVSICLRVALSMICGGVIGIERSRAHQVAGMRTYMLVCLGATVVMLTGQYMQNYFGTGAQVISGIGFLGAGGIISSREKIRGLTTAAGLWASACIGLSIGIGFYAAAIVFTIAVFLTLSKFRKIERYINTKFHKDDA